MIQPPAETLNNSKHQHRWAEQPHSFWRLPALAFAILLGLAMPSGLAMAKGPVAGDSAIEIEYFVDDSSNHTLDTILKQEALFQPTGDTVSLGYHKTPVWFKFHLHRLQPTPYFVHLSYFATPQLKAHILKSGDALEKIAEYQYGAEYQFSKRPVQFRDVLIPINAKTMDSDDSILLYIKVESYAAFSFKATLHKQSDYYQYNATENAFVWLLLGGLLALAIYNLFLFVSLKTVDYLYYSFYVLSFFASQIVLGGIGYQYLWPNDGWINPIASMVTLALVAITAVLFARSFLNSRVITPKLDKLILLIPVFALGLVLCIPLVATSTYIYGSLILAYLLLFSIISFGAYHLYIGNKRARLFVLAWVFFITGSMITVSMYQGLVPANFYTFNAAKFGGLLEAILLALALADKINFIQAGKRNAERRAKEALTQKNTALQSANVLKDRFMATMSHELRTPLNGILGAIELMQSEQTSNADKNLLNTAQDGGHHLKDLLDKILEYTDLQSGQYLVRNKDFEWAPWIDGLNPWIERANQKGLQLHIYNNVQSPWLCSDRAILRKIITQLLDNSIRFSTSGTIAFTAHLFKAEDNTHQLALQVEDQGDGIPEDAIDWLSQGFSQLEQSSRRFHGGLGIGLGLCHAWVKALNGELHIASELGKGTRILIDIPVTVSVPVEVPCPKETDTTESQKQDSPTGLCEGDKILVVEDNPVNQTILVSILKKLKLQSLIANNGQEALETLDSNPDIGLVFMDCEMPIMDGYQATHSIRQRDDQFRYIPIIAVTANAMSADRQKCLEAGMSDYLAKPVKLTLIEKMVDKWKNGK